MTMTTTTTTTTTRRLLHALLAAALLAALPAQAAVSGVMTYSGFLKSAAGAPVTTSTNITFRLYTTSSGGTAIWTDTVAVTPGADGWFSAPLGILNPLLPAIMGQDLYLSLQVGSDTEFTQRARVTPSGSALAVDWSGVQGKPSSCPAGQYLTIDGTGSLLCATPAAGGGGFTPPTCTTAGQVLKWSGTAWTCAADVDTGITSVLTLNPLGGTGVSGSEVSLTPCPAGQILQSNGFSWVCILTPSGGTGGVTSVAVTAPVTNTGTASAPNIGVGLASASTPGALSAADWTAFNGKQAPITGGPCAAGSYVTNVNASTGAVTCAVGPSFKVDTMRGTTAIAATGATPINSITITAPSAGTALVTGSGYCNLTQGAGASYRTMIGASAIDQGFCGYAITLCVTPGCDFSMCGFHDFPAAATPAQHSFFSQRTFSVAAGANTFYLNAITNTAGPGSCSGQLTATFQVNWLP